MPAAAPSINYEALRAIREARGVDGESLAAIIGVSASHLSNVEQGKRGLSLERIQKAAKALRVKMPALLAVVECETCGASSRTTS